LFCLVYYGSLCISILSIQVQRKFQLPPGDFPNVEHFGEILRGYNIDDFKGLKPHMIRAVDDMLDDDIPNLLKDLENPYD
jgi:EH domain-containing protein 1